MAPSALRPGAAVTEFRARLGLSREVWLAWSSALFATIFYLATLIYASKPQWFSKIPYLSSQSSKLLLILRILSEIAGVLLGATIHGTFDAVQWRKISRTKGIGFLEFLSLQAGTGVLGLLSMIVAGGLPPYEWLRAPRLMSGIRLMSELIVPILAILIMGMGLIFLDAKFRSFVKSSNSLSLFRSHFYLLCVSPSPSKLLLNT
jgi:hypothetical protein